MDAKELKKLRRRLDRFVGKFSDCIKTAPSRRHLRTYVGGQVGDLERKNAEAIALAADVPPRSMQEFLAIHRWDHNAVRGRVQELVMKRHASEHATAVIDESSFPKKGDKTVGVQRQYCGAAGKKDNCVVSVHLGYVAQDFHALVDTDLYLPHSWLDDAERCREAGVPGDVPFRTKPRIALDLLERTIANGVRFRYLAADELYGRSHEFRTGVADLGLVYVVDVPCSMTGWTKRPRMAVAKGIQGQPGPKPRLAGNAQRARRIDALWERGGPSWQAFHIKNTGKGPIVWEVRAVRFFPAHDGVPDDECWLIIARNVLTGEVKYFFSNASKDTPVEVLLHIAFSRWHIERLFQDAKGQLGMDQFEVRGYVAVMRHLILTMVSLLFLVEQTQQLREKKSGLDDLPGPTGRRSTARRGHHRTRTNAPA